MSSKMNICAADLPRPAPGLIAPGPRGSCARSPRSARLMIVDQRVDAADRRHLLRLRGRVDIRRSQLALDERIDVGRGALHRARSGGRRRPAAPGRGRTGSPRPGRRDRCASTSAMVCGCSSAGRQQQLSRVGLGAGTAKGISAQGRLEPLHDLDRRGRCRARRLEQLAGAGRAPPRGATAGDVRLVRTPRTTASAVSPVDVAEPDDLGGELLDLVAASRVASTVAACSRPSWTQQDRGLAQAGQRGRRRWPSGQPLRSASQPRSSWATSSGWLLDQRVSRDLRPLDGARRRSRPVTEPAIGGEPSPRLSTGDRRLASLGGRGQLGPRAAARLVLRRLRRIEEGEDEHGRTSSTTGRLAPSRVAGAGPRPTAAAASCGLGGRGGRGVERHAGAPRSCRRASVLRPTAVVSGCCEAWSGVARALAVESSTTATDGA